MNVKKFIDDDMVVEQVRYNIIPSKNHSIGMDYNMIFDGVVGPTDFILDRKTNVWGVTTTMMSINVQAELKPVFERVCQMHDIEYKMVVE